MLLSFICYDFIFENTKSKMIRLESGYYSFEVIGGRGGTGCQRIGLYDARENNVPGGNPAKITGIFQIKANHNIQCLAGSKPITNCNAAYQKADEPGSGGDSGDSTSGAGGGYSAFWVADTLAAIAGGGGGAGLKVAGIPAGGVGYQYSYKADCSDLNFIKKKTEGPLTWYGKDADRDGADGQFKGAGGGGGAIAGSAGRPYSIAGDIYKCLQPGTGGSSYINRNLDLLKEFRVMDGVQAPQHNGHGVITITNITLCASHCVDCDMGKGNVCYACEDRYWLFKNTCYDSCSHTPVATYKDESSKKCFNCMEHCKSCKSSSVCDVCEDGYTGTTCTKIPDPTAKAIEPEQSDINIPTKVSSNQPSIAISKDGVYNGNPQNIGNRTAIKSDDEFPWWIIAVVGGGIVLIAVIIGSIACARRKKEDSSEMDQEEAVNYPGDPATPVTTSNPLYSMEGDEEDPFKNDFTSDDSRGAVFKQEDIEEIDP